jgi:hypothetical protein
MRILAAFILSAMAGVSAAASSPYVQIGGASSGLANTCSPASSAARVLATMDVPAGASYQYSVFVRIVPDPNSSMYMDDMMMMGMMMMGGMSMDPYYALLYTSPLRAGPSRASAVSLDIATPAAWYTSLPGVPAHTQLMAQISTYGGAVANGSPVSLASLTWDCSSGEVTAMTNDGNAAGAAPASASSATASAIEFYNAALDHYFVSASAADITSLDAAPAGWARTGLSFKVFTDGAGGATPVCRFYIPPANGDSHFYSALASECASVHAQFPTFVYESPSVFYVNLPDAGTGACGAGTTPLYRLWNKRADSNHRYTTDPAIKASMIARGYVAEGFGPDAVAMCVPS